MKIRLLVAEGAHAGTVIPVARACLLIGAAPQCHVRAASPVVNPRHCALLVRGERVSVRDLDSRYGTYINDRLLRGELELRDGDFLRIGPLMFVVLVEAESGIPVPDPEPEAAAWLPKAAALPRNGSEALGPVGSDTGEMPAFDPHEESVEDRVVTVIPP